MTTRLHSSNDCAARAAVGTVAVTGQRIRVPSVTRLTFVVAADVPSDQ